MESLGRDRNMSGPSPRRPTKQQHNKDAYSMSGERKGRRMTRKALLMAAGFFAILFAAGTSLTRSFTPLSTLVVGAAIAIGALVGAVVFRLIFGPRGPFEMVGNAERAGGRLLWRAPGGGWAS